MCRTYLPNLYGESDGINAGLPTDRFQVDWHINSEYVENRLAGKGKGKTTLHKHLILNPVGENGRPPQATKSPREAQHFVQVPINFQAIKAKDMPLAHAWRLHTRQLFSTLFAQNYTVTDFILHQNKAYYRLNHTKRFSSLRGIATVKIATDEIMAETRANGWKIRDLRSFVLFAMAVPGNSCAILGTMKQSIPSNREVDFVSDFPIFDGHNDTLLNLHLEHRGHGRSFFKRSKHGHIDLPPRPRGRPWLGAFLLSSLPTTAAPSPKKRRKRYLKASKKPKKGTRCRCPSPSNTRMRCVLPRPLPATSLILKKPAKVR